MNTSDFEQLLHDKEHELGQHYKPGFLHRKHTVFQFYFDQDAPFYLTVMGEAFSLTAGISTKPTISLFIDTHETCWGLMEGRLDGMKMFMDGRYRADGHIVLSQLLLYLFKPDNAAKFYEVQD